MNPEPLAIAGFTLAAIPAGVFILNLFLYTRLRKAAGRISKGISVLIPARNEERNLQATIEAVLANEDCEFEVIVLDDYSTDRTAAIVKDLARRDPRVRLKTAPPLPAGWCGKQHACHVLAGLAQHPLLVFVDADVRLRPDALARMAAFMEQTGAALASGVPQQELGTFGERLLLPQIHFILLGYLPLAVMRHTTIPAFSAGCGQLFVARRDAYEKTGGHAAIRTTLHDGLKLSRLFRRHGFKTDLFDAADLAVCRMYQSSAEVWAGLGKNATEALAAPGTILPMTVLLLGGQVLPFLLLALAPDLTAIAPAFAGAGVMLAWLPRVIAVRRFRQPLLSAALHPLGLLVLVWIQWQALIRRLAGKPATWKGRNYAAPGMLTSARSA